MRAIKAKSRNKNSIAISKGAYPTKRKAWIEAGVRTGWKPKQVNTKETNASFIFTKKAKR